jgi:DNA sulfur modification protein DndD
MILESIQLKNFRQFFGKTPKIEFASGDKNVTVFHGENGSGKTALLNAFTWVLYGRFSSGFQLQKELVNKQAVREADEGQTISAWVELVFKDNGRRFSIRREVETVIDSNDRNFEVSNSLEPKLTVTQPDGESKDVKAYVEAIGRVLPEELHSYFFFDGERIEKLVQPDSDTKKEIAPATKKLLGIEVLNRSITHLKKAKRQLETDYKKIGGAEAAGLIEKKEGVEAKISELQETLDQAAKSKAGQATVLDAINKQMRGLEKTKNDQLERDRLIREIESLENDHDSVQTKIQVHLGKNSFTVFLGKSAESFTSLLESLRERGELPAGIKRSFVEDLLKNAECICGRPLGEHDDARKAIEKWRSKAGLDDVEAKALRMDGEISGLIQKTEEFWTRLDDLNKEKKRLRQQLSDSEDQLTKLKEKLKNSPEEDVRDLERRLEETEAVIDECTEKIGSTKVDIGRLEIVFNDLEEEIKKTEQVEEKQRIAKRRVDVARDAIERIKQVQEGFESDWRQRLESKIREVFRTISITPYNPVLDDNYCLRLTDTEGGEIPITVAASTGESQVLSLSFIGSVIQLAKEQKAKDDQLTGASDVTYPVVMDSPFGALDPHHRSKIAQHLPTMADQVVTMVTKSQWSGEVESQLNDRIGKTYVLTYYSPRDDIDRSEIQLVGEKFTLVEPQSDHEYTSIVEVKRG